MVSALGNVEDDGLPEWAAKYCRDQDFQQAVRAYRKRLDLIGAGVFREVLSAFIEEIEEEIESGGEVSDNRGAVFMWRLKEACGEG